MSIPQFLISADILVCERVLFEADGVISAIRMVDLFFVPTERPPNLPEDSLPLVQGFVCAILKAVPGHTEDHIFDIKLTNTLGQVSSLLPEPVKSKFGVSPGFERFPGGVGLNSPLSLWVKRMGTCYVSLFVDGQEVARAPISIAQKQGVVTPYAVPPAGMVD